MELYVLHLDGLTARGPARRLEHDLVVEAEAELGHAAQIALHLDGAEDLGPQHVSVCRDEQVEALHHVEEHLVLAVADALGAPRDGVCDGDRGAGLDLELVGLLGDVLLEDLGLGGLWVAKVHHLVEEFVNDDKVVADGFFLEGFEVLSEDLDDLVKEEEDLGGIRVAFCESEEVEVVVADVEILDGLSCQGRVQHGRGNVTYVDTLVGEARRYGGRVFFGFGKEDGELFDGGHGNVTSVVSGEKGLRGDDQISLTGSWRASTTSYWR